MTSCTWLKIYSPSPCPSLFSFYWIQDKTSFMAGTTPVYSCPFVIAYWTKKDKTSCYCCHHLPLFIFSFASKWYGLLRLRWIWSTIVKCLCKASWFLPLQCSFRGLEYLGSYYFCLFEMWKRCESFCHFHKQCYYFSVNNSFQQK